MGERKKCIQDFGEESSQRTDISRNKSRGGNSATDLAEVNCGNDTGMKVA
jgi:hypothetical protein